MSDIIHQPAPWLRIYPRDRVEMAKILELAGIDILPEVVRSEKPERPFAVPTLTRCILAQKPRLQIAPVGWKTYAYLDENGRWTGVCAAPENIRRLAKQLDLRVNTLKWHVETPDKIGNTTVNVEFFRKCVQTSCEADMQEVWAAHYSKPDSDIPYFQFQSLDLDNDICPERLIKANYAMRILAQILNRQIDVSTLPRQHQKLYKILGEYCNQWYRNQNRPRSELSNDRYIADKELPTETKDVWILLTKINQPDICRDPENPNPNTFDYIEIRFGLRSADTLTDRNALIKDSIKDIIKLALQTIRDSKKFQRYDIPISFLKPTRYAVTAQSELVLTFELKKLKTKRDTVKP